MAEAVLRSMIRKRQSNNGRRSNILKGTAKAFRVNSENMTVLNLHTPRNFERLVSALPRHTEPNIVALGNAQGKHTRSWVAKRGRKQVACGA